MGLAMLMIQEVPMTLTDSTTRCVVKRKNSHFFNCKTGSFLGARPFDNRDDYILYMKEALGFVEVPE